MTTLPDPPPEPLPDPIAEVDALVAAIAPRIPAPPPARRDTVLVTGPWLAGAGAVAAALAGRLPDRVIVDAAAPAAPAVVVFVVSAAAALTESDCALLAAATAATDAVIGVLSGIDRHRHWPEMMSLARITAAGFAPRYRTMPWVAAAAPPGSGQPRIDDLVAAVQRLLADPAVPRRNRLRSWERQLRTAAHGYHRAAALRRRRRARSGQTIRLRGQLAATRVQLTRRAADRCAAVRAELTEQVAGLTRRRLPGFETALRDRVAEVIDELDRAAARQLAAVAAGWELDGAPPAAPAAPPRVEIAGPALRPHRLETRLITLFGAGFGLGVTLTMGRLLAGLPSGLTTAGATGCALAGLSATVWVVTVRALLRDRALWDRWVLEVIARLRSATEELVALRVLAAEAVFAAELAERHEADTSAGMSAATIGAAAGRAADEPAVRRALAAVRADLAGRRPRRMFR